MKKLLLTLAAVTAVTTMSYAQGVINFQNESTFAPADAITVGATHTANGGNTGDGIGGDKYSVQLLWAPGTYANQAAFNAALPSSSAVFTGNSVFLANTGPLATFSGFFDAGAVNTGAAAGTNTFQVRAWYNVGFSTYAAAQTASLANLANVGTSVLFTGVTASGSTPVNTTIFPGFQVTSTVPEPGTLALAGLGAASLLLFRRKK